MKRALLTAGSVIALAAAGCVQVDGVPTFTAAEGEAAAAEPDHAGTRLGTACKGAGEPRDRAWACLMLAGYFERGIYRLPRDPARAAQLRQSAIDVLEASCDRGEVTDCTRAAVAIGTVIGPWNDPAGAAADAVGWMVAFAEHGCRGGDARGCALLGLIHEGGRGVARSEERSSGFYDKACDGGHLQSCLVLAARAEGPARVAGYERACREGSGFGCAAAAHHHARGAGVPSSVSRAGALFEEGCLLGNPAACVMGAELLEGADPGQRRGTRLAWEACDMGIPEGCLLLGGMIERERGPHRAFEVYHRACELGDKRGCDAARRVRGRQGPIDPAFDGEGEMGVEIGD